MSLKLKSKKVLIRIFLVNLLITFLASLFIYLFNIPWHSIDYKATDELYKRALDNGKGPGVNNRIVYLNITDKSLNAFGSSSLDRKSLAEINNILAQLNPNAVFYDIIFPRSSEEEADSLFTESLKNLGVAYLPAGFQLYDRPELFRWEPGVFYTLLYAKYASILNTTGEGKPYYASWALTQKDEFAQSAFNSGHISIIRDPDGILRHFPLVIKIDSLYFPAVTLSIFLDYNKVPFEKIKINWGESIVIPALPESFLEKDVVIPIDEHGNVFIPYQNRWADRRAKMIEAHKLTEYFNSSEYLDELVDNFEGSFVFISNIAVGASDLGQTTIEENVPLIMVHSALLNGMLDNSFYSQWNAFPLALLIIPLGLLLGAAAFPKSNLILYVTGPIIIIGLAFYAYYSIVNFSLFPLITSAGAVFIIFLGMIISLNVIVSRDQAFIKNAFSKYVPAKVIDQLLERPELLKLGGEERILTILFSDIEGFTSISEKMNPADLVHLLNEYLTEMTKVIIGQGGIIDKYIGDAILAEFGAPIQIENHADAAVTTALLMQKRLKELDEKWKGKGFPVIRARIGINTGNVVIGNMGSDQVFDYTVVGDSVNLASRLESANKFYSTNILISGFTFENLSKNIFGTRLLDVIKVKGKSKAVKVYEIFGSNSDFLSEVDNIFYENYDKGFHLYLSRNFEEAKSHFEKALAARPEDKVTKNVLQRIEVTKDLVLDKTWDGAITLLEK
jgi:adenylate cyclase